MTRLSDAERAIAQLHAEQLELMAELYRRAPGWITSAQDTVGIVDAAEVAAAEIGVALRISRRSATDRLSLALQVIDQLPGSVRALHRGELSLAKLAVIAGATTDLSAEHARQVEQRVLPRAGRQTPAGLGVSVARAVLVADPDAARRRHHQAAIERTVRFSPRSDGMARLWARLPANYALRCYRELGELAEAAASSGNGLDAGDNPTADARRADTLVDLIIGAATVQDLVASATLPGAATDVPQPKDAAADRARTAATCASPQSGPAGG